MVPTITQAPMDVSGMLGSNVMFTCTATGIPLPDITWMDEDGNIVTTTRDMIIDGTVIRSILTLSNLQDEDFDDYTCTATNMFGSDSVTALLGSELLCHLYVYEQYLYLSIMWFCLLSYNHVFFLCLQWCPLSHKTL